jgi:hypothetical protein
MSVRVLKATLAQKQALEGTYEEGYVLEFIQDANNDWVVNDKVVNNGHFLSIREQLQELPLIDYQPKVIN